MTPKTIAALVALAAVGVAALVAGRAPLFLLMLALSIAAGGELFRLARSRTIRPSALVGLAGIAMLLVIAYAKGEQAPPLFPAAIAATVGAAFLDVILRRDRGEATRAIAFTIGPVLVAGLLASYVVALRSARQGARLAGALVIMWLAAELAMALVAWKRSEVAQPRARRERTAAAVAGGLLGAIVVAIAFSNPFGLTDALLLGVLVGLATAAGHLMSEMIVEPGDRGRSLRVVPLIDGLFVSAPVFFYVFRVIGR